MLEIAQFFNGKRVLLTGHTGFKGSWLALWLQSLGAEVYGYALESGDNRNFYNLCQIEALIQSEIADIRDREKLEKSFRNFRPEIVFHLAAQPLVRQSYQDPVETYETNVLGTAHVLDCCRASEELRAVVVITSDKCYENQEWVWGYRENDPVGGFDPYSSSKGCVELLTRSYMLSYFNPMAYGQHGVGLATVRAGNVIGGGDWSKDRLVPDCITALLQGESVELRHPNSLRPWQHVLEPLWGYMMLAAKLSVAGDRFSGAWNFGPDDTGEKTVSRVVERLIQALGGGEWHTENWEHDHEAKYLKLDSSKAKANLDWFPVWDFDQTVEATVAWYKTFAEGGDLLDLSKCQIRQYQNDLIKRKNDAHL